jgi:hypothetical protein
MDKDRTVICNIISKMLDYPNDYGIYPTTRAYDKLEEYIEGIRKTVWGDQEVMVIAAFRYSLGRMTYIVKDCCDWLIEQWPNFREGTRALIQKELEAAFERDDDRRRRLYIGNSDCKPLGHDCDREQWERVRALWEVKG